MKEIKKFHKFAVILLLFLVTPPVLWGEQPGKGSEPNWESRGEYVLTVKGDRISLKAKNASLKEVLEDIGRRMNIDVVAKIPREEKISIELDMVCLEDAIKRFKTSYAYISKSRQETGKITKIVVVPKGMEHMLPGKYEYDSQLQPSYAGSGYDPQPLMVRPGYASPSSPGSVENELQPPEVAEYDPQPELVGSGKPSQPAVAGSESNSESPEGESEYNPKPALGESEANTESPDDVSQSTPPIPDVTPGYNPQPPIMEGR